MSNWRDEPQLTGMIRQMGAPSVPRAFAAAKLAEQFGQQQQQQQAQRDQPEHVAQQQQQQSQM